jgi:hypothetical protein
MNAPDTTGEDHILQITLQTPCTLSNLLIFAHTIVAATAGNYHNTTVTSTNNTLTVIL